jgi:hypothetical protein
MGLGEELGELLRSITDMIRMKEMVRIAPYEITVTTVPQRILPQGFDHLRRAQSVYMVLTDLGTMFGNDVVMVGDSASQLQPLYSIGDMYFEENQFMRYTDITQLWVKTTGHSATVTVSGISYPAEYMGGLF